MVKLLLSAVIILHSTFIFSQDYIDGHYLWNGVTSESIGSENLPLPTDSISLMRDQGELMDFSGGFHEGDSVADLTVYDVNGEPFHMNSLLEEASVSGKYTVLFSGSNSCNKATGFFNTQTSTYHEAQTFMTSHLNDFNWIMVYGYEAHPIDTHNCLSNCPPAAIAGPSGVGEFQHVVYQDRLDAMARWVGVQDGTIEIPETISTYANGSLEPTGEQNQNYTPLGLDIPVYADNPDNQVYDTFFKKPFGVLVIDCSGQVVQQGDWFTQWMIEASEDGTTGVQFLSSLLYDDEELSCHEWVDFCNAESPDTDLDGLCDEWEIQNGTNADNICHPYGEDSDFDGLCNLQEESLGLDPFNPDSDEDLLSDSEELIIGTDPLDPDSDGDGETDGAEITAGTDPLNADDFSFVEEIEDDLNFSLVNDAASGNIKLELEARDNYSISLRTSDGKTMFSEYISSNEYIMEAKNYSVGTYLISVEDSQGRVKTQRVYIE